MRPAREGFTLIEVVIAVAIVGIITSFVYAALTGTIRSAKIAGAKNEVATLGNAVVDAIADDLAAAAQRTIVPFDPVTGRPSEPCCFQTLDDGEGDSDADGVFFTTGSQEIIYRCEYDYEADEFVLWRSVLDYRSDDPFTDGRRIELLRGRVNSDESYAYSLAGLNFLYCANVDEMRQGKCQTEWNGRVPPAVRIELSFEGPAYERLRFITVATLFMGLENAL